MREFTKEELKELQQASLTVAKEFTDFCRDHGLLCYFCGGGLIGAVRHGGFIPWDDDLDFFMPRPDYERLIELWNRERGNGRFRLLISSETLRDHNCFITIRDCQTTLIKPYQRELDIPHGVNVDVFPLDGCPDGRLGRQAQKLCAMLHILFRTETVPLKHGRVVRLGARLLLALVPSWAGRCRIWRWAERRMSRTPFADSEKTTELCAGPQYWNREYHREWFDSSVLLPFENTLMPAPTGYDGYLRSAFGDYMRLPPEEKRHAEHDAVVLDTRRGYPEYREYYGANRTT